MELWNRKHRLTVPIPWLEESHGNLGSPQMLFPFLRQLCFYLHEQEGVLLKHALWGIIIPLERIRRHMIQPRSEVREQYSNVRAAEENEELVDVNLAEINFINQPIFIHDAMSEECQSRLMLM